MLILLSLTIGYQQYKETNMNFRFTTTSLGLMLCATASAVQFGAGVDYGFNKVEIKDADFGRFADTHEVTSNPFNIYAQLSHNVKIDKKSTLDLQAEVRKSLDKDLDVYKNQINNRTKLKSFDIEKSLQNRRRFLLGFGFTFQVIKSGKKSIFCRVKI